jgi:transcriptional regulator with PAS, ATPase and Fis domain
MLECMLMYDWPGNLRELDLLTRRLLALHGQEPVLRRSFLPAAMIDQLEPPEDAAGAPSATPQPAADREQYDRRRLGEELRRHGGNITRAAGGAGISRARAYRLMADRSPEQFLAELDAVKTAR